MTTPPETDGALESDDVQPIDIDRIENIENIENDESGDLGRTAKIKNFASRWLPLCFFAGGFLVDFITLREEVNLTILLFVGIYVPVITVGLWLKSLALSKRVHRYIHLGVHLCMGGLFSALVVLYFRSAGHFWALLIVLALLAAMVWNEFAHREESQVELVWAIYSVSLVMYLNFLMPYLLGSISALWFYASTATAIAIILGLRKLAGQPFTTIRLASIATLLIVVSYIAGWIPPVPLVMENSLIGTDFERRDGDYTALVHDPGLFDRLRLRNPRLKRHDDEPVYILSAVSAPDNAEVHLEHRWFRRIDGTWTQTDAIPISIRGGRKDGWRFYSVKQNLVEGDWKVETALIDGAVLGYQRFHLETVADDVEIPRQRQSL